MTRSERFKREGNVEAKEVKAGAMRRSSRRDGSWSGWVLKEVVVASGERVGRW
jgi:hypothetical protein